ncbi:NAD(P)H-binding protein [Roseovarius sp. B08]|uniref:NAD(P)H-binding protein n=1 Tax=Roseovarius sp. B08 TaxID=3449223 RepID=UPI003EDCB257
MKVFIIGMAGGVGRRVARALAARKDDASGLVRRPEQIDALTGQGVSASLGDILAMSVEELAEAMRGSDAVVFTAGAGGSGREATTAIDGDGPGKLAQAAALADIQRFLLVSVFPEAWRERHMNDDFEHYIQEKKRAEIALVASDLDWVILRPSALSDDPGTGQVDLGLVKIHREITRDDVAATIVELLHAPEISCAILEVTGGAVAIEAAVAAMKPRIS